MPTLTGPCQSQEARGTLAGLLTYSRRRGRNVAGVASSPRQPRTLAQVATRIFMTWITKQWSTLTAAERASWLNYEPTPLLSPYHAYLQHNVNRFKNIPDRNTTLELYDTWPSKAYPTTKATKADNCGANSAVGGPGYIDHTYYNNALYDRWFISYHLATPGINYATYANLVFVALHGPYRWTTQRITGLPPGVQTLWAIACSATGKPRSPPYELTATVT